MKLIKIKCNLHPVFRWKLQAFDKLQSFKIVTSDRFCQCTCCLGGETNSWFFLFHHLAVSIDFRPLWPLKAFGLVYMMLNNFTLNYSREEICLSLSLSLFQFCSYASYISLFLLFSYYSYTSLNSTTVTN